MKYKVGDLLQVTDTKIFNVQSEPIIIIVERIGRCRFDQSSLYKVFCLASKTYSENTELFLNSFYRKVA